MIYTSYYGGKIIGQALAISLFPPKKFDGKHLPLFAPSEKTFKEYKLKLEEWKHSKQDEVAESKLIAAQEKYTQEFNQDLLSKKHIIDLWISKLTFDIDVTLLCYKEKFCHRHLVGRMIASEYSDLWGGEIGEIPSKPPKPPKQVQETKKDALAEDSAGSTNAVQQSYRSIADMTLSELLGFSQCPIEKLNDSDGLSIKSEDQYEKWRSNDKEGKWLPNIHKYALFAGEIVKIVGRWDGKWQIEAAPDKNPEQKFTHGVAATSLSEPPKNHNTWSDVDFKRLKNRHSNQRKQVA